MCLIATKRNKCFSKLGETSKLVFLLCFSLFLCVFHLPCQKICLGTLIGFLNVLKYNSLLVMEDHCLALQDIFMKRHMHYLLVKLLQKSRLQMEYLKAQFSEKGFLLFIKGSVFLYLHQSVSMCFCPMSHIHFASICGVRSYGRSSYLLHGFGVVRRLAFHVRDQWSLFLSEVHAKLTRLVNAFSVQTSMFCLGVCTLQFEDSKGH